MGYDISQHRPPSTKRSPFGRFVEKNTRKNAIDAFCFRCKGGGLPETIKKIKTCENTLCTLYEWRPYK